MSLNSNQQKAVDYVNLCHNIFLGGQAGTGKSYTINRIVSESRQRGKTVYVTATTGIAATNIGGCTLHSWAGVGIDMSRNPRSLATRILRDSEKKKRWTSVNLLIIDEISMMNFDMMVVLEQIARIVRNSNDVFGGIRLLLSGDFLQLPPVQKDRKEPLYLFEDPIWNKIVEKNVILTEVYRQDKQDFVEILMRVRENKVSEDDVKRIQTTSKNVLKNEHGITPTILFCTRNDVNEMNEIELKRLPGNIFIQKSDDFYEDELSKSLHLPNWQYPEVVKLKVGAQVLLLTNIYCKLHGLVNGSRGVVVNFDSVKTGPETVTDRVWVRFLSGVEIPITMETIEIKDDREKISASRNQFPLMLAWSLTIHKSQGQTIELLDVDLGKVFTYAQAYVALSRGVSLEKMIVRNFSRRCVRASPKVIEFYKNMKEDVDSDMIIRLNKKRNYENSPEVNDKLKKIKT